jgi:hypothetical protein
MFNWFCLKILRQNQISIPSIRLFVKALDCKHNILIYIANKKARKKFLAFTEAYMYHYI